MKFALNGAVTIGTLDGANIEIMEEVGKENIFIFGMDAEEVTKLKNSSYDPLAYYHENAELKRVIDQIRDGYFCRDNPSLFKPIVDSLLYHGDTYMLLADYASYIACQDRVSEAYKDKSTWLAMSILNTARMGKFSSDRTIHEYSEEIWGVKPLHIKI